MDNNNYQLEKVDLAKISLDPNNPRIPQSLHGKDEGEILKYMVKNASIIELIDSIGENSFFPGEPIILVAKGDGYKVIEGNRRVSALKLMQNLELARSFSQKLYTAADEAENKPTEIPSLIVPNEADVHKFLGFRHVTGVKNWNALEKARYLNQLKVEVTQNNKNLSKSELYKELAKAIGSRSDYVRRILTAFDLYSVIENKSFFSIDGLDDTTFFFVNLSDSLSRKNITEFLGVDFDKESPTEGVNTNSLNEWSHWLYEKNSENKTRMRGTSSHLSKLNDVMGSSIAFKAFRDGKPLSEAWFLTHDSDRVFNESIQKSVNYLREADRLVHQLDSFNLNLEGDLKEILGLCKKINMIRLEKQSQGDEFVL